MFGLICTEAFIEVVLSSTTFQYNNVLLSNTDRLVYVKEIRRWTIIIECVVYIFGIIMSFLNSTSFEQKEKVYDISDLRQELQQVLQQQHHDTANYIHHPMLNSNSIQPSNDPTSTISHKNRFGNCKGQPLQYSEVVKRNNGSFMERSLCHGHTEIPPSLPMISTPIHYTMTQQPLNPYENIFWSMYEGNDMQHDADSTGIVIEPVDSVMNIDSVQNRNTVISRSSSPQTTMNFTVSNDPVDTLASSLKRSAATHPIEEPHSKRLATTKDNSLYSITD
jgi:hypothetical protein